MPEQHRHLASKYEDSVNMKGAEACCGGRPPTASLLVYVARGYASYNAMSEKTKYRYFRLLSGDHSR